MNVFDDLYYGNINISSHKIEDGSEEQLALKNSAEAQNKLYEAVPDNLRPLLDDLIIADSALLDATSRRCFELGFKYGMRFAVAGLKDEKTDIDISKN